MDEVKDKIIDVDFTPTHEVLDLRHELEIMQFPEIPPAPFMEEITMEDLILAKRMVALCKEQKNPDAIGMAANQLRDLLTGKVIDRRICVLKNGEEWIHAFNPMIKDKIGKVGNTRETCFSYPGKPILGKRTTSAFVEWIDEKGNVKIREFNGLVAVCWQHEMDHLDGVAPVFANESIKNSEMKMKPNDPCNCGSGKKWKRCCMRP